MRSLLRIRPLIYGTALFVAGVAVGTSLAGWASAPSHIEVQEGTTLVSYLPEAVMSLAHATLGSLTAAQQSVPGALFQVLSTFADGRPAQRCSASTDIEGRLDKLATLTARRSLSFEQRRSSCGSLMSRIRSSVNQSGRCWCSRTTKDAIAVIVDGYTAEVTLQPASIDGSKLSPWIKAPALTRAHIEASESVAGGGATPDWNQNQIDF
jgi:hypothetical protein